MRCFGSGPKWWLQFVIAPTIAGGAMVPILASVADSATVRAAFDEPAKAPVVAETSGSAPASPLSAANSNPSARPLSVPSPFTQQTSRTTAPQPAPPIVRQNVALAASPLPPSVPQRKKEPRRADFYATNADDDRLPGGEVSVHKGDSMGINWAIDSASVTGAIHLRTESNGRTVNDAVVENAGHLSIRISGATRMVLTEVRPEGERFIAELNISAEN